MTAPTSTAVMIDWHKSTLPCIILTGADTNTFREAALQLVEEANLKHWLVSDCHDEQSIRQIPTTIRKDISYETSYSCVSQSQYN